MIQTEPENIEKIRARLRKMTDLELRQYGRAARDLSDPNVVESVMVIRAFLTVPDLA